MNQEHREYMYSLELFEDLIGESIKDSKDLIETMVTQLDAYRVSSEHWESKRLLLASCTTISAYIAEKLYQYTVGRELSIQNIANALSTDVKEKDMDYITSVTLATYLIEGAIDIIYTVKRVNDELVVSSKFILDEEEADAFDTVMYPPPMLSKPLEWTDNRSGGWLTNEEHIILGNSYNRHDEYQAVDAINQLQAIEWELDPYIIAMEEEANSEEFETVKQQLTWGAHKELSKKIYQEYLGRKFHFVWRFDKRGRSYSSGYHINIQSTGYKKASLTFGNKHLITGEL